MLHTKFPGHWHFGSGDVEFKVFNMCHIRARRLIRLCDRDHRPLTNKGGGLGAGVGMSHMKYGLN